jgi:hypothetical protein
MNTTQSQEHCNGRAVWRWFLVCLFAMFVVALSSVRAEPVQVNSTDVAYVAAAADVDADCDGGHALSGTHCCAGVACAGYAQYEATTTLILPNSQRFSPAVQFDGIGQSLRPTPQPPQA